MVILWVIGECTVVLKIKANLGNSVWLIFSAFACLMERWGAHWGIYFADSVEDLGLAREFPVSQSKYSGVEGFSHRRNCFRVLKIVEDIRSLYDRDQICEADGIPHQARRATKETDEKHDQA